MSDWIGLAVLVGLAVAALVALSFAGRGRKPLTEEEFEQRVAEAPGLLGASMIGLEKAINPVAARAAAVQQDFKGGLLDEEQKSGDGDDKSGDEEKVL
jgi:hypothetical protein